MIEPNPPPANRAQLDYAPPTVRRKWFTSAHLGLAASLLFIPAVLVLCGGFGAPSIWPVILLLPVIGVVLGITFVRDSSVPEAERRTARLAILIGGGEIVLMLAVVLLPDFRGRPREQANRIKCASNLRQIGQSIQIYANENNGALPPSFDEILLMGDLTSEVFVCPATNDNAAKGPTTQAALQQWRSPGFCSYVYVPPTPDAKFSSLTSNHVLAYEPASNHGGDGMNVLYADIHVDWIGKTEAARVLAELQAGNNPPRPAATPSVATPGTKPAE